MIEYLVVFALSIAIIAVVQGWPKESFGFVFWSCVALAFPCLLAGLRAVSIGTDVVGYAQPLFELAQSNDGLSAYWSSLWWRDNWHYVGPADFEPGYSLLAWASARLFGSFQSFLFIMQALTVGPIYVALARHREEFPLAGGMATYYLVFFNQTLNMMRQGIAIALVFLAVWGLYRAGQGFRRQLPAVIALLAACTFHSSAVMGFAVLGVRLLIDAAQTHEAAARRAVVVVSLAVLVLVAIGPVRFLIAAVGVPSNYLAYLGNGEVSFRPNELLLRLPTLAFAVLPLMLKGDERGREPLFALSCVAVGTVLAQLTSLGAQNGRIGLYFYLFCLCVPGLCARALGRGTWRAAVTGLLFGAYCLAYWVVIYAVMGSSETVPYMLYWN